MRHLKAFSFSILVIFVSCGKADYNDSAKQEVMVESDVPMASSAPSGSLSSSWAKNANASMKEVLSSNAAVDAKDSHRKFIRTAQMKFRVADIYQTSIEIENLVQKFNGFVVGSDLVNTTLSTCIIPISSDSSLESITYRMTNNIEFRVPSAQLDTTLRSMAQFIDYLDYRKVVAQDVTIDIKANQLQQERYRTHGRRLNTIAQQKSEMQDANATAQNQLNADEAVDNAIVQRLNIQDRIEFSTINLKIYQRSKVARTLIANPKNIEAYEPSFFSKIGAAIVSGWNGLKIFTVGLTNFWPLWLIAAIGILLYRKFKS